MSAISEIKDAIQKKIAGQGSQVDIGNGLPSVLNGMADLIQKSQEAIQSGYIFAGCFNGWDSLPEYPDTDTNRYFAFLYDGEGDTIVFTFVFWTKENGWDLFGTDFQFRPMLSNEDIKDNYDEDEPDSQKGCYITPNGLIDYIAQNLIVDMSSYADGDSISSSLDNRLRNALAIKAEGVVLPKINNIGSTIHQKVTTLQGGADVNTWFGFIDTEDDTGFLAVVDLTVDGNYWRVVQW